LFDKKKPETSFNTIEMLRHFTYMIGLSGSTLTDLESSILFSAFKTPEVKFPSLRPS
jgi:hypothetical protein